MRIHPVTLLAPSKTPLARQTFGEGPLKLPFRIMSGRDGHAVIVHQDGALSLVIRTQAPAMLTANIERIAQLERSLLRLLRETDVDLQLVSTNFACPMNEWALKRMRTASGDSDYQQWFVDYLQKWMLRIAEVHFIATRELYVVVTHKVQSKARANGALQLRPAQKAVKTLSEKSQPVLALLEEFGCGPQVLNVDDARQMMLKHLYCSPMSDAQAAAGPASLSVSSLLEPNVCESPDSIHRDNTEFHAGYVRMLPASTTFGWLGELMHLRAPHTLSVHLSGRTVRRRFTAHSSEQQKLIRALENGEEKAVDVGIYLSIWGEYSSRNNSVKDVVKLFAKYGAHFAMAEGMQSKALLSCLPTGRDFLGAKHTTTAVTAADCFSLFDDKCGEKTGVPFGFTNTAQPVLFDPFAEKAPLNTLLLGAAARPVQKMLGVLAWRLALPYKICMVGSTSEYRHIVSPLGALAEFSIGVPKAQMKDQKLMLFDTKPSANKPASTILKAVGAQLEHSEQPVVVILPEVADWIGTTRDTNALIKFIEDCQHKNIALMLGTADTKAFCAAAGHKQLLSKMHNVIMLPQKREDIMSNALAPLALSSAERATLAKLGPADGGVVQEVLFRQPGISSLAYFQHSPMEFWLCGLNQDEWSKRKDMMLEVRQKTPSLNDTDVWRQTLYYMGLQYC